MYMTLGLEVSITMLLMEMAGKPVDTNVHGLPPSPAVLDFHSPPLAAPAQTMFGDFGFTAIARTRPPTFVGPRERHELPAEPESVRLRSFGIVLRRTFDASS